MVLFIVLSLRIALLAGLRPAVGAVFRVGAGAEQRPIGKQKSGFRVAPGAAEVRIQNLYYFSS
jgi:hypothetical protein